MKTRAFITLKTLLITSVVSVILFVGLIFLLPSPNYTKGFENLHELQEFAKTLDEWIKMENENILFPSYKNYYSQYSGFNILSYFKDKLVYIFFKLGLFSRPFFSFSYFKNLLNYTIQQRMKLHYDHDFVNKIILAPDSKIVVFGTTQGAFHGLIRCLEQLKNLKIIDENLSIVDKNYYIVFLGNVVNRSPYTIELLSIVMKLLYKNPDNVIYLKGEHETYEIWKNHTLNDELMVKLSKFNTYDELVSRMNLFFNSLPYAAYFNAPFVQSDTLISVKAISKIEKADVMKNLAEIEHSEELSFLGERITAIKFGKITPLKGVNHEKNFQIRAVIQEIKKRKDFLPMDGLRLLEVSNDSIYWTVYSSALESARRALKFFYDAFVIVESAEKVEEWTISLFNRDVRSQQKSFQIRKQLFFSGKPV